MKFLDPTNDYAFKRTFGNENKKEILISFLNSILARTGEKEITDITLLNPYQAPQIQGSKETIVDVRCHDQGGSEYIVEMQVLKQNYFDRRVLYYASKAYHTQLGKGEHYHELKPVIFLGILNFEFTENSHWISTHRIYDVDTKEHVLTDFDFTFVELPKFTKTESELESVADKWIYFLKNAQDLQAVPEVIREEALKVAFEVVNQVSWSQEELDAYEYRKMAIMDAAAVLSQGRKEGLEEGLQKGLQKGRKEGRKEGEREGRKDGQKEGLRKAEVRIAREMLAKGMDVGTIKELTGIDTSEL